MNVLQLFLIDYNFDSPTDFNFKRCIVRSTLVFLAVLLGEFIPKFDLVMGTFLSSVEVSRLKSCFLVSGVIGGTLTGPLIFILPPLFYTRMLQLEKRHDKRMLEEALSEADLNDTDLLLRTSRYGTIPSPKRQIESGPAKDIWKVLTSECMLASVVIVFGITATFTSTFYNVLDIKGLNQFWSPCIQNISLSYQLIPK